MIGQIENRPSTPILECGLKFDHFTAPFSVWFGAEKKDEGFISVGDALDYAVRRNRQYDVPYLVYDADFELVYEVGN